MSPSQRSDRSGMIETGGRGDDSSDATLLSKTRVNRAGELLVRAERALAEVTPRERLDALAIVDAWRQTHAAPLEWVTAALGRRVGPIATQCVIAQRLKRMPQIIKKLARYGNMNLARMQDLGGCRIVLADLDQVEEAASAIRRHAPRYG